MERITDPEEIEKILEIRDQISNCLIGKDSDIAINALCSIVCALTCMMSENTEDHSKIVAKVLTNIMLNSARMYQENSSSTGKTKH